MFLHQQVRDDRLRAGRDLHGQLQKADQVLIALLLQAEKRTVRRQIARAGVDEVMVRRHEE